MIDEIEVRNVALINQATLVPSRGLTVLTGETGAGKTALLSAMKLLMGARASADMVRDGADALEVSGRFFDMGADEVPEDMRESLDLDPAEDVVATRRVGADGRSRASVNGHMASARELAQVIAPAVDLCGQFEHQQLMKPAAHLGMLDAWAGAALAQPLENYQSAFQEAKLAAEELQRVQEAASASSAKLDEARFALARIDEIGPSEGEYEELRSVLDRAQHAEALATAVAQARAALSEDDAAIDKVNLAASSLEQMASVDDALGKLAHQLREAGYVLEDVAAEVRSYQDKVDFDPETLQQNQERFASLQGLMRSWGPTMQQVFEHRAEAAETVSLADNADERLSQAQAALDAAEAELAAAANVLDAARVEAAPRFAAAVSKNMERLEMPGAGIECQITRLDRAQWTKSSPSSVEFMYRPGHGLTARPLARIASGGEVSRVMLAIKVVLGETDSVDTLVFDEVDAGVGGATAVSLAQVLADLAQTHQVIVVTHLAQVAVRASAHYVVSKHEAADGTPETQLAQVSGEARVAEVARMLSGSATQASLAHAKELLENFS